MNNRNILLKKILLAIILLVLMLPLIQQHAHPFEVMKLKGASTPAEKIPFSKSAWLDGSFQDKYEVWYNENFGFRNTLVRMRNQIGYDLYNLAYANGVVVGKDNYLYELNYIRSFSGQDFLGEKELSEMARKIKLIQDTLEKKNITLLVCLAAGKASYFPEFIPESYGSETALTNYKRFASLLKEKNINNIDFNKWFMENKNRSPYPLYPKTGIHWSRYASMHVMDSIVKWIELKRKVDMPAIFFDGIYTSDSLHSPDDDIGEAMNLLWPIKPNRMAYQHYHYEDTTGKAKISLMAVSDSFFWNLFDSDPTPSPFAAVSFYYYDRTIYRRDGSPFVNSDPEISTEDVNHHQVVMLMATECNIGGLGWGFINDAYDHFVLHKQMASEDKLVHYYEGAIRMDKSWLEAVKKKAQDAGIPLDSMIHMDAAFMAQQKMHEGK